MLSVLQDSKGLGKDLNLFLHSNGFEKADGPTKTKILSELVSYKGDATKIKNVTDLVTQPGFSLVSSKVQNVMLDSLAKTPEDGNVTYRFSQYLAKSWFLAAEEPRQIEILNEKPTFTPAPGKQ